MALTIAEREHRELARILAKHGQSDTEDVPLSAVADAALTTLRIRAEKAEAQVATLTAQRDEFKRIGQGFERDYRNTFEQSCKNLQRAETLTAALRRYEWQPIETAPKDVSILAWMVFKNMAPSSDIATWHEYTEEFCGHSTRGGIPTHWMPLPDPPAVLRAASEGA